MNKLFPFLLIILGCSATKEELFLNKLPANVLNYHAEVNDATDREALVFSDQGAWFGFSLPGNPKDNAGFVGPFLMTQENGKWLSPSLLRLEIKNSKGEPFNWQGDKIDLNSYSSHLEKVVENTKLKVIQQLFFNNQDEAILLTKLINKGEYEEHYNLKWSGDVILDGISLEKESNSIKMISGKSPAIGQLVFPEGLESIHLDSKSYAASSSALTLKSGEVIEFAITLRFSFALSVPPTRINASEAKDILKRRLDEKQRQLNSLHAKMDSTWSDPSYKTLLAKTLLTLQNNWRAPAGELKHSGLFPSYHYKWFHGFWAWDSWKHAVALAQYDALLAKEQVYAMYSFMNEDGFIPDCVYRDTTIEAHNYRNTKPPLSAWAIWNVYTVNQDLEFLKEIYPMVIRQHEWWYKYRDHDGDGICEYGSTDGSLIAAKWDSGMDNAVRFDDSEIIANGPGAFSLNQESVDLNAYLYAEKQFIAKMAEALSNSEDANAYLEESEVLAVKVRSQFFDEESGWFYDTNLDGDKFIKVMGCEGWIPLWANLASLEQAEAVKNNIILDATFNTKVPLQTLAANHPKFKPDGGYWRGPTWIDQAYFGIRGLKNYGYDQEADELTRKLFNGAEGLIEKGPSIRENYQPITGHGLESESFSWSAAHYLLLLLDR